MDLLSHPFRLRPDGAAATVVDGSDDAHAEGLAVLMLTRKGERVLVPDFGVPDPAFGRLDTADLNAALAAFGPPIRVTGLDATPVGETTARLTVTYEEA